MYRPSTVKPGPGPLPPFGPPPPYGPPYGLHGPCTVPPPGYLPPGVSAAAPAPDSLYLHSQPPTAGFTSPNSSSFSTVDPMLTHAAQWKPTPVKHLPSDSDRAGEEFLRCIAANKPLPDYLKGNMAHNLAEAFKSASSLKEAVKSDAEFQKHVTRSKSHSRSQSRGRSRGKSRGRSRGKSRGRSQARSPAKSCARSRSQARTRSRERSKSRARAKSRARSNNRARSRSRSQSHSKSKKSHVRSKRRARRSKSRSSSHERAHGKDRKRKRSPSTSPYHSRSSSSSGSNISPAGNSLLEGLKLVMNSKDLEDRLPSLKDALLTIQATDVNKKSERVRDEHRHQQYGSLEGSENDSMLLPHDRVGSDFSWLQGHSQPYLASTNNELDDEESFLYGVEDTKSKQATQTPTALFPAFYQFGEQARLHGKDSPSLVSQQHHQSIFSGIGDPVNLKQPHQAPSSSAGSTNQDSSECERIKHILKTLRTTNISEIVGKMQAQKKEKPLPSPLASDTTPALTALPALSSPNVRKALESLQSLIKATKEKRTKKEGRGTSQTSDTHKAGDFEESKREKQARLTKMESLMKELEELLKLQGLQFLTPVIGFYCQKCEEFIGDLNSAESHAAIHSPGNLCNKVQVNMQTGERKGHSSFYSPCSNQPPYPSDRRVPRDYSSHRDTGDHKPHKDHRSKPENLPFQEEPKKERLLITVSCEQRAREEGKQKQANGSHGKDRKVQHSDSKKKLSKDKRSRDESSDSSDDDKGRKGREKSPKKRKKDKKKKKKKDKH